MKKIISILTIVGLFIFSATVIVAGNDNLLPATLKTNGVEKTLSLPVSAIENSPVIYLGEALDPQSGEMVQGYAIVHYAKPDGKGNGNGKGNGGGGKGETSSCYEHMAKGAKWKTVEPWIVGGASSSFPFTPDIVLDRIAEDISKWEDAADGNVGDQGIVDIFGDGSITFDILEADTVAPDGANEVYFGSIEDEGAIGVTIVWGIFGGPPRDRVLVEWDQVYDRVDYDWSLTGEAGMMDFESIATHELGHSAGMGDLYESACAEETMYGYAGFGETNKRDLYIGDITGINKLY